MKDALKTRLKFKFVRNKLKKSITHHFILKNSKKYTRLRKSMKIQSFPWKRYDKRNNVFKKSDL